MSRMRQTPLQVLCRQSYGAYHRPGMWPLQPRAQLRLSPFSTRCRYRRQHHVGLRLACTPQGAFAPPRAYIRQGTLLPSHTIPAGTLRQRACRALVPSYGSGHLPRRPSQDYLLATGQKGREPLGQAHGLRRRRSSPPRQDRHRLPAQGFRHSRLRLRGLLLRRTPRRTASEPHHNPCREREVGPDDEHTDGTGRLHRPLYLPRHIGRLQRTHRQEPYGRPLVPPQHSQRTPCDTPTRRRHGRELGRGGKGAPTLHIVGNGSRPPTAAILPLRLAGRGRLHSGESYRQQIL